MMHSNTTTDDDALSAALRIRKSQLEANEVPAWVPIDCVSMRERWRHLSNGVTKRRKGLINCGAEQVEPAKMLEGRDASVLLAEEPDDGSLFVVTR